MTALTPFFQLIGALLTLASLSFIYKENPFYRWAEYTVIGVTTGNWLVMAIKAVQNGAIAPLMGGQVDIIIAIILGVMYFARYFKVPWLYRYPVAILTGIGLGFALRGQPGVILKQIYGIMQPITPDLAGLGVIIALMSLVFGLAYFTYTRPHTGSIGVIAKIGRYFIMAFIGMRFVNEVNAYVTILAGRMIELLNYILP
jgi:hypothetical protein